METVVVSLALARLGAVQNPVIHIYREREVGFALRQTGAKLFLVPGTWRGFDFLAMANKLAADMADPPTVLVAYDELPEGDPATLPDPPTSTDDVRWIYYTSGTTSDPKGVRHTDGTLLAGGIGLAVALEMSPADVGSIAFPFAHIGGPDYLITMLAQGFPAMLVEAFDPTTIADTLNRVGATMAGGSTAFYSTFLVAAPRPRGRRRGGAALPDAAAAVGRRCPEAAGALLRDQARDGHSDRPRLRDDRGPDDQPGRPRTTPTIELAYTEGAPIRGTKIAHRRPGWQRGSARRRGRGARRAGRGLPRVHRPGAERRRVRRAGPLPDRRPRCHATRRSCDSDRTAEGRHHPQGREHLRQGDRGPALRAPTGRERRGDRPRRQGARRAGVCGHRAGAGAGAGHVRRDGGVPTRSRV